MHYHQVFGCAMGSPVSAVIADLVMNNIEERALSTSPVTPSWWRRYVDDSNVCLKKTDVQVFHQHLNSIDSNIQFTIERAKQTDKGRRISFLDTQITALSDGSIEIEVFRKETHTNKYLDFASHNPMQHKEAVVKTLLHRANLLPSRPELRTNKQDRVLHDLRANGYPDVLFKKCVRDRTKERPTQERPLGLAVLPYVRGASDRVGRVLKKFHVRTAFKPKTEEFLFNNLGGILGHTDVRC
ncbi:uncharacterized protein LOC144647607 [Oculina patagonica]